MSHSSPRGKLWAALWDAVHQRGQIRLTSPFGFLQQRYGHTSSRLGLGSGWGGVKGQFGTGVGVRGGVGVGGGARVWGNRSRYVVSRGFAGFCAWTTVPTTAAETTGQVGMTVERVSTATHVLDRRKYFGMVWTRGVHSRVVRQKHVKRDSSSSSVTSSKAMRKGRKRKSDGSTSEKLLLGKQELKLLKAPPPEEDTGLLGRMHIHRPSKDEMLAAATGFFQRLRIRTKWTLIRQMRPYNFDDITAFFSWLFLGHVLWVVLGTTTFFSLAILVVNSVFAQEFLAGAIGNYLTKETGVKVVFESAIVPRWKDNCISFKNVFVSRRPGIVKHSHRNVSKGSSATAAAAAAAAVHADDANRRDNSEEEEEDTNYTQYDVTIDTVNVTLSFTKWMNGKGLLKDVEIKGVRGVIDRTHVYWLDDVDPRSYKHQHSPGDFEIDSFKLEDLLVTVHQPDGFRPFSVSIFSADLPQLRKQWLFYDFLSANHMSGSYDDSLFTIHPRQSHGISPEAFVDAGAGAGEGTKDPANNPWKKTSRLRIDGLEIDHLNRGVEGPFSWIQSGNVDIIADVMLPPDSDLQFTKVVQEIVERMEATMSSSSLISSSFSSSSAATASDSDNDSTTAPVAEAPRIKKTTHREEKDEKFIVLDLHVQLNDVRAAVPIFTKDLSYVNNALVRPIVAYINSRRRTYIPVNCRVVKRISEFDGSWTVFDSGLMDDLSAETYEAFARDVMNQQARRRRFRKVGLWSLQLLAQALLMAMAGNLA
ncbi:Mitochondrial distribution and morphology protein 31, mitochondrial precursor [Rhizina undulata]